MNAVEQIQQEVKAALRGGYCGGACRRDSNTRIMLETPKSKDNGDYATNIAMQLTKLAKKPPRAIAEAILEH